MVDIKLGKICVYKHIYKDKVVYVGQGSSSRPYNTDARNELWLKFFEKKKDLKVEVVKWCKTRKEAIKLEGELISKYKPKCNILNTPRFGFNKKKPEGQRKNRVFSVSFHDEDMEYIDKFLADLLSRTGIRMSRNEFIRKSALACTTLLKEDVDMVVDEVFKNA